MRAPPFPLDIPATTVYFKSIMVILSQLEGPVNLNDYLTPEEAAKILGMDEQVLRNNIRRGRIKACKILKATAISKKEVAKWKKKSRGK